MQAQTKRIPIIDIIRGVALFGIFMVNLPMMANGVLSMMGPSDISQLSSIELILKQLNIFIFQGKFMPLFSMLFGYGFFLFFQKGEREGIDMKPLFRRRMFVLMLFGLLHIIFMWSGDILFYYALFGFILIAARNSTPKTLIILSVVVLVIPMGLLLMNAGLVSLASLSPEMEQSLKLAENGYIIRSKVAANISETGSYFQIMVARITEYLITMPSLLFIYLTSLSMFYLGAYIAKKGIVAEIEKNLKLIKITAFVTLLLGATANTLSLLSFDPSQGAIFNAWSSFWGSLGGVLFAIMYGASLILIYRKYHSAKIFNFLAAAGRMPLTNYLMQSFIVMLIIYPFGMGMFGKLSGLDCLLLALGIYATQLLFSKWWLSRYQFGPLEKLWRILTYGNQK